jgi:hypothetical protein
MRGRNLIPLAGLLFLVATCTHDTRLPTSPFDSGESPSISTMDANDYDFQFLDPLGPADPPAGTFDPNANPRVEICPKDNGDVVCGRKPIAELVVGGKGPRQLLVMADAYEGQWHVKPNLDPSLTYQISVLIGETQIGSIDTRFDDEADYQLTRGERLPIRFWVGMPPAGVETPIDESGGDVELGEDVKVEIPAGALDEETTITIDPAADVVGAIPGTVFDFGPDGLEFNVSVKITICYDRANLGAADEALLRLVRLLGGGGFEETDNSDVDLDNHCVFGDVDHFSEFAAAEIEPPPPPPPEDPDYVVAVLNRGNDFGVLGLLTTVNPETESAFGNTTQNLNRPYDFAKIPNSNAAWVMNRGDGTIVRCVWGDNPLTVPPGCGNAPIAGFGDPVAIAFAAFNQMLVLDHAGEQVHVRTFEGAGDGAVAVSAAPRNIVVLPGGTKAYVAADGFVDVLAIDGITGVTLETSIEIGHAGQAITLSPAGDFVYVTAVTLEEDVLEPPLHEQPPPAVSGALYRINTATDAVDGAVIDAHNSSPLDPVYGIVVNGAGITAYAGGGQLYIVNLATWTISAVLDGDDLGDMNLHVAEFLALSPDETTLWGSSRMNFGLQRIDLTTQTANQVSTGSFDVGGGVLIIPVP